jgi:hypothetical protein
MSIPSSGDGLYPFLEEFSGLRSLVIESLESLELSLSTRFTSSLTLSRSASTISLVRKDTVFGAVYLGNIWRPGGTDYGVELGAPQDMSRLQVRLVGSDRPSIPRNAQRDCDMEMIWCSEFGRLQQLVANSGGEVYVQRALDVGVEPVKTITFIDSESEVRKEHRQIAR